MKLKLLITHLSIFAAGIAITFGYFIFEVLPATSKYIPVMDVKFIELPGADEPVYYGDIIQKRYLASLYRASPFYFFKRDEGLKINADLAKQGYTPATHSMFSYNFLPMQFVDLDDAEYKAYYEEAYKWAKVAESQDYYLPISFMITLLDLERHTGITKHLEKIDSFVKSSSIGGPAKSMGDYFAEKGNSEKAKYYYEISEQIESESRPQPVCYTIKPFKGL